VQGRGRVGEGQMGSAHLVPGKQTSSRAGRRGERMGKAADLVSVEGLSSSTAGVHLKNLLMSVKPIQVGQIPAPLPTPPLTVRPVYSPWKADTISAIYCETA
uniref:Uncharacterized protein n=1 Tax=Sinocyclocheilus rhinocerous TaxID=307959 RepID=A0A673KB29_9TELE